MGISGTELIQMNTIEAYRKNSKNGIYKFNYILKTKVDSKQFGDELAKFKVRSKLRGANYFMKSLFPNNHADHDKGQNGENRPLWQKYAK